MMSNHQVESQDTLQRRLEVSPDLPRGQTLQAESWPCEPWKPDRSVGNRGNPQNLAKPAHVSNLQPNEKEVPLLQSETEAKEGKHVFVVTATFRVEGTSPFSVDPERMQSVIVEMLAEKTVISQIVRLALVEMKEILSCPPPVCRVPFDKPRKSVSGPTATRRRRRRV